MSFLSKIFGYAAIEERKGISLGDVPAWEISPPGDPEKFVRALHVLFPMTATIYLEGTSNSRDIIAFFSSRQVAKSIKVALGTILPKPSYYHMPATLENLDGLAKLFANHATPEICIHFHIYDGSRILLEWHDSFGRDPMYVSRSIAEDKVKSFCAAIGSEYKPRLGVANA